MRGCGRVGNLDRGEMLPPFDFRPDAAATVMTEYLKRGVPIIMGMFKVGTEAHFASTAGQNCTKSRVRFQTYMAMTGMVMSPMLSARTYLKEILDINNFGNSAQCCGNDFWDD